MEISDELRCLFTAQVTEQDGSYRIELPKREVMAGTIDPDATYRIGILAFDGHSEKGHAVDADSDDQAQEDTPPEPPVDKGEVRTVAIEDIGSQGDGVARVERGYVIIVPETEPGDEVRIEIEEVKQTVAFGTVIGDEEPP